MSGQEAEMVKKNLSEKVIRIIKAHGGKIRMSEAIAAGINRYALYSLRDKGTIEQVSRGIFRLSSLPPISNPDLVIVALRAPKAVVCLVSALSYHKITTQIPHEISIALEKGSITPRIGHPPIAVYRFSKEAFSSGVQVHEIDGTPVRVYSPEKTLADCFKFRNKVGMEVVLEALKRYKERKRFNVDELFKYARICRVEKIMRPYLEASR
jgi:predicted transcriptional regulator of viral defense system